MHQTREFVFGIETQVVANVQTDTGCVREANEDGGRHVTPNDEETLRSKGTLTIVADGMGGHASGEVASQMAIDLITEVYYGEKRRPGPDALRLAIEQANSAIYHMSTADPRLAGMGTTVIALIVQDNTAFSAHVGDSRLYRLRAGRLEMLTLDHSQVMEMVQNGVLTMEQARYHEDKNVILKAVGTQPTVEVEVSEVFPVQLDDVFLLCSDGLSDMLDDADIQAILANEADGHLACQKLIGAAKARGGHDNITTGIVRITSRSVVATNKEVPITREVEVAV